ncbi:MAG: hypothetical protein II531_02855 [Bacteroidales bacterium]|nr:hypothetical protein [Bacteroidales bacterium]
MLVVGFEEGLLDVGGVVVVCRDTALVAALHICLQPVGCANAALARKSK